eukprot:13301041-Alexandrium_andersonii.AAC.1
MADFHPRTSLHMQVSQWTGSLLGSGMDCFRDALHDQRQYKASPTLAIQLSGCSTCSRIKRHSGITGLAMILNRYARSCR